MRCIRPSTTWSINHTISASITVAINTMMALLINWPFVGQEVLYRNSV